jgi:hypothetical protein
MNVTGAAHRSTLVRLPGDVSRPFEVYVNGVRKVEGRDFVVRGGALVFDEELREEGRLGVGRWTSMVLGVAGSYKRNDSVDVVYMRDGRRVVASKLPIDVASVESGEPG